MNIENKKQLATLLLAVGLGLFAAFLTSQYVKNSIETQTKTLAKEYGKRNQVIVAEMEKNYVALKQRMDKQKAELERKLKAEIKLQRATMTTKGSGGAEEESKPVVQMSAFSVRTPVGKRALTIKIDSLSAVGGLINPGDFIDVLAHLEVPKDTNKKETIKITSVLFQNIQVLAVGTNFKPIGVEPAYAQQQKARSLNITLAVTSEEAGLLTFAQANGKLQLALRSPAEQETLSLETASWKSLADFVMEKQGTDLLRPTSNETKRVVVEEKKEEEVAPFIEIFKSGRGTNF